MTEDQLKERVAQLEAELEDESQTAIDPQILAKVKNMLQFSVMDIKVALDVLGVVPTDEQKEEIEQKLISAKAEAMSAKADRGTIAKW